MGYTIEKAKAEDIPAIMRVLRTANMHHIPSKEMPELDYNQCFVAKTGNHIVGVGGYKMISPACGKTTVLVVEPKYRKKGIGEALQLRRMKAMVQAGAKKIITNADLPESIEWYKKHFGYKVVGTLKKFHEFGHPGVDHWTTLELNIGREKDGTRRRKHI